MEYYAYWLLLLMLPYGAFSFGLNEIDDNNVRLSKIEAVLEMVLEKNRDMEKRIDILETENENLKVRLSVMEKPEHFDEKLSNEMNAVVEKTKDANKILEEKTEDVNKIIEEKTKNVNRIVKEKGKSTHRMQTRGLITDMQLGIRTGRAQRRLANASMVAFTAVMGSTVSNLGQGQPLVYEKVITNVGNGYHSHSGLFTVPVSGVYVFSFTVMVEPGDSQTLELVTDGRHIINGWAHASNGSRYVSSSAIVTLQVNKGSEVWVRTVPETWHGTGTVHGFEYSTFSGWLLEAL